MLNTRSGRALLVFMIVISLVIYASKVYYRDSDEKVHQYKIPEKDRHDVRTSTPIQEKWIHIMDSPAVVGDIRRPIRKESSELKTTMETLRQMNAARVNQTDPGLIELIRKYFIDPPSDEGYSLNRPNVREPSWGQTPFVDKMLGYKTSGFFIECGGYDGEDSSNTLYFERFRNWTGLLIEPDPVRYQELRAKKRKSFSVNACLSTAPYPVEVTFNPANQLGRIQETEDQKTWIKSQGIAHTTVKAQCFPLLSILLALGQKRVDYFSLDVEGDELKVLKTLPLNEFDIKMFSIEIRHLKGRNDVLKEYLQPYRYRPILYMVGNMIEDVFYIK